MNNLHQAAGLPGMDQGPAGAATHQASPESRKWERPCRLANRANVVLLDCQVSLDSPTAGQKRERRAMTMVLRSSCSECALRKLSDNPWAGARRAGGLHTSPAHEFDSDQLLSPLHSRGSIDRHGMPLWRRANRAWQVTRSHDVEGKIGKWAGSVFFYRD